MAAGYSRRFGAEDKRMAYWPITGRTLLGETLHQLQQALANLVVVIRPEDSPQALGIPGACQIIHAPHAAQGLGASIADALDVIQRSGQWQQSHSLALMLGDMPTLQPASVRQLLPYASEKQIVRPIYQGQPGHPVVFGRDYWPALQQLSADNGARQVLQHHQQQVRRVVVADPGVVHDIDTAAALTAAFTAENPAPRS
ncbi:MULTISPECIES: nucleotidyltransferase family protein [unclassified Oceanobacter]|uniref:nucleotidyltransferase family protein n=1 Tax=unclassified Oceanobacter TaxID=2620260 RepID=UPI0026E1B4CE|nr:MULTISPECIES: nucleotidyltransferase family protein [unclassified Oceanobacter]MDO6680692.1 nucleotidyltransferase family protein [Oceanobacter sp. 5_MG-2023]MDP2610412.1 nucleotidyltransferase family protein [Oceanobacter sp. 1_MG-2023]MDP2613648.1 nucleotidyltransferase family protein [Oceanobacter sp. 2_MG-2023]